ncbi:hypothetical protein CC80DRAFT_499015 [Byssothecium circinans]|uniref:Uncharacterized protein n=1 Tax=Byssothecium circinans TaxID=147558 RepID=A0A6A5UCM1_9PLEO|nr:hypothetical protein CC80DRAFT_499015 [Byssothecium circinans]
MSLYRPCSINDISNKPTAAAMANELSDAQETRNLAHFEEIFDGEKPVLALLLSRIMSWWMQESVRLEKRVWELKNALEVEAPKVDKLTKSARRRFELAEERIYSVTLQLSRGTIPKDQYDYNIKSWIKIKDRAKQDLDHVDSTADNLRKCLAEAEDKWYDVVQSICVHHREMYIKNGILEDYGCGIAPEIEEKQPHVGSTPTPIVPNKGSILAPSLPSSTQGNCLLRAELQDLYADLELSGKKNDVECVEVNVLLAEENLKCALKIHDQHRAGYKQAFREYVKGQGNRKGDFETEFGPIWIERWRKVIQDLEVAEKEMIGAVGNAHMFGLAAVYPPLESPCFEEICEEFDWELEKEKARKRVLKWLDVDDGKSHPTSTAISEIPRSYANKTSDAHKSNGCGVHEAYERTAEGSEISDGNEEPNSPAGLSSSWDESSTTSGPSSNHSSASEPNTVERQFQEHLNLIQNIYDVTEEFQSATEAHEWHRAGYKSALREYIQDQGQREGGFETEFGAIWVLRGCEVEQRLKSAEEELRNALSNYLYAGLEPCLLPKQEYLQRVRILQEYDATEGLRKLQDRAGKWLDVVNNGNHPISDAINKTPQSYIDEPAAPDINEEGLPTLHPAQLDDTWLNTTPDFSLAIYTNLASTVDVEAKVGGQKHDGAGESAHLPWDLDLDDRKPKRSRSFSVSLVSYSTSVKDEGISRCAGAEQSPEKSLATPAKVSDSVSTMQKSNQDDTTRDENKEKGSEEDGAGAGPQYQNCLDSSSPKIDHGMGKTTMLEEGFLPPAQQAAAAQQELKAAAPVSPSSPKRKRSSASNHDDIQRPQIKLCDEASRVTASLESNANVSSTPEQQVEEKCQESFPKDPGTTLKAFTKRKRPTSEENDDRDHRQKIRKTEKAKSPCSPRSLPKPTQANSKPPKSKPRVDSGVDASTTTKRKRSGDEDQGKDSRVPEQSENLGSVELPEIKSHEPPKRKRSENEDHDDEAHPRKKQRETPPTSVSAKLDTARNNHSITPEDAKKTSQKTMHDAKFYSTPPKEPEHASTSPSTPLPEPKKVGTIPTPSLPTEVSSKPTQKRKAFAELENGERRKRTKN